MTGDVSKANLALAGRTNNTFAVTLYHRLVNEHEGDNIFWSPFSMLNALTIAAEGARGETAAQMGDVLGFPGSLKRESPHRPWDLSPIHAGLSALGAAIRPPLEADEEATRARIAQLRRELDAANEAAAAVENQQHYQKAMARLAEARRLAKQINELLPQVDRYEVRVANGLWGEKSFRFRHEFLQVVETYHGAGRVFSVDFKHGSEAARRQINAWVEEQTQRCIQDLLSADSVSQLTRLLLANAIYFKGEWTEPFSTAQTKARDFTLASGAKVETLMMTKLESSARYAAFEADGTFFATPREVPWDDDDPEGPGAKGWAVVELPYKGGELSLCLVAPNRPDGLPAIESRLSAAQLSEWTGLLEERAVRVILPRFRLEASYATKAALQALGMVRAFVPPSAEGGAQFDGMGESTHPDERLFVSEVFHKAFVEVNEKGTEAAAATSIAMEKELGLQATRPYTPTFRADRPFLFAIRHVRTGMLLFMGRMLKPR